MTLPPLQPTPNLTRLLAPDEEIIYTAKLHPLYGWKFLGVALCLGLFGYWLKPLWLVAGVVLIIYRLPFNRFECAVTNKRLLLRQGRFGVWLEAAEASTIASWHVVQAFIQPALHAGMVTIDVLEGKERRHLQLPWLWHPLTFIEALEAMQAGGK